jgi:hypothetical protein
MDVLIHWRRALIYGQEELHDAEWRKRGLPFAPNGNAVSATHYAFMATASMYHPSSRREITLLDK